MRHTLVTILGRGRLASVVAITAVVALLIAGVMTAFYLDRSYKAQKVNEVSVQAKILASTVTAALAFNDRAAAQEYINALAANPEVREAALYDSRGSIFVSYSRGAEEPPQQAEQVREPYFEGGRLVVLAPVSEGKTLLGTVYIRTITERFDQRLARYAGIALLVTMAALLIAVLGTSQAAMSRANRQLEERAADLAAANAKLQAEMEQRQKVEDALRQSQKMETVGQLTGGVAHDFNNLLTIILGNLRRLRRRLAGGVDPAQVNRAIDNAIQGGERAVALTRTLLAFSRRQPLNPKPIDVNKLVGNMSDLLRHSLGAEITIESVLAPDLWRAHADPNQLENAILNLAVNSRDAMPQGGKLTIATANACLDARYAAERPDVTPGQYVTISVSDTGTGMTKEVIEKAFEPFFTTKDVGKGTGLGLSQVYGFSKQSGGHVKIDSKAGQETTVTIYLPRLVAEEHPVEIMRRDQVPGGGRSETVLVVEDEEGVREYSAETLREMGCRVFEAATAAAALNVLDRQPDIALLFTDIGLPGGMDGNQLANEARRRRPRLKVLFTTGYAQDAVGQDGQADPEMHLLMKPFASVELAVAVREVLEGSRSPARVLMAEDDAVAKGG